MVGLCRGSIVHAILVAMCGLCLVVRLSVHLRDRSYAFECVRSPGVGAFIHCRVTLTRVHVCVMSGHAVHRWGKRAVERSLAATTGQDGGFDDLHFMHTPALERVTDPPGRNSSTWPTLLSSPLPTGLSVAMMIMIAPRKHPDVSKLLPQPKQTSTLDS